jgi:SAM-dependent methyltransferase
MMAIMSQLFGEVAGAYHKAQPGYPAEIVAAIRAYHGGTPDRLVEVGAGTGLATATLLGVGAPTTCVEPDHRMARVLAERFPQVEVVTAAFEEWTPPAGGVPALACAMAWHWLDPATRNRRAHDALRPGGTLAVFGHRYDYVDPAQRAAIRAAFESADPQRQGDRPDDWVHADIAGSGLFTDVRAPLFRRDLPLDTAAYLRLVGTFSPQLRRPPALRERVLAAVGAAIDGFGGTVVLDLRTTLVLARRPA